jgi:LysR family glycine cleavage system transcriptional activator
MIAPRRYLPSTHALLCFEAVARLGTATAAAQELALTQSGVSRQLKTLETQLGASLFYKDGRGLRLTSAGQDYAAQVRSVLERLARASITASTNPDGGTLNLAILPAFGMHWLAPRLSSFAATHPEVTINLSTRLAPFDFRNERFDAAIHFGREDWAGATHLELMPETVVPVCAPDLMRQPARAPADLLAYSLLHLDTRPKGWARWFGGQGLETPPAPGMMFDQFSTMAQAAIHGMGIALLPTFVAEPYLKTGQLLLASNVTTQSIGSYYLVWPSERANFAPIEAFRTWLGTQTRP